MTFQNADKLIKKLNLMSNEVQGEILKKSVKRGGLLVQKQARLLVNSKSGNLGRSIKERTEQRPSGASSTVYTNLDMAFTMSLEQVPMVRKTMRVFLQMLILNIHKLDG